MLTGTAPGICSDCHTLGDPALIETHRGALLDSLNCLGCHAAHGSEGGALIASKRHEPFASGDCTSCHGEGTPRAIQGSLTATCDGCHSEVTAPLVAGEIGHAPFEAGDCGTCHNPHAANEEKLLQANERDLCKSCHEDVFAGATGESASHHPPFANGECSQCHDPHRSTRKGLLKDGATALCSSCHEDLKKKLTAGTPHAPVAQGRCETCHDPHESSQPSLLQKPLGTLCQGCHPTTAALRASHRNYPLEGASCATCHDPHASTSSGLLKAVLHAPFEKGTCAACHTTAGGVKTQSEELCLKCHAEVKEAMTKSFAHPLGETACLACHSPHAAADSTLMRQDTGLATCGACHEGSGFYGKKSHLDATPNCGTCHDLHGSDQPRLLKADVNVLCASCHDAAHEHTHPIGEGIKDPVTGTGMTCLSCHQPHSSDFPYQLHADQRRDLCVRCHPS
jgi:predicted CXXCH cytochrome family protein